MEQFLTVLIRAVVAYLILLALTRIMGKREISQLTYFDYIVGITIGSITANMSINTSTAFTTMLPALLVFCILQIISSFASLKDRRIRKLLGGSSTMLIKNGKILEGNLAKERLNFDELSSMLRNNSIASVADVEFAFLETDGKLSVMKKANKQPNKQKNSNMTGLYNGIGRYVIEEGKINNENLRANGLTTSWLMSKINERGVNDISKIYLALVDDSGTLYLDLYDDNLKDNI